MPACSQAKVLKLLRVGSQTKEVAVA